MAEGTAPVVLVLEARADRKVTPVVAPALGAGRHGAGEVAQGSSDGGWR
jgi:hypothetical protein